MLLDFGNFLVMLSLFIDLPSAFLFFLALFFGIFSIKPVFFPLELTLSHFLSLFFFKVANESLSGDVLALKALPDTVRHAL